MNYNAAFSNAVAGMGCPSTGCIGYELKADLDFDTNNDGIVDGTDPNSYANWTLIGGTYSATFDGNHHTIANLTINSTSGNVALFNSVSGTIREVGLPNVNIRQTGARDSRISIGALVGSIDGGTVLACWSSGKIVADGPNRAGGLVGRTDNGGHLGASYSTVSLSNSRTSNSTDLAGLIGTIYHGTVVASYSTGSLKVLSRFRGASGFSNYIEGVHGGIQAKVWASYTTSVSTGPSGSDLNNFIDQIEGENESWSDNYYDSSLFNVTAGTGATGKTTAQLQTPTSAHGHLRQLGLSGCGWRWHVGRKPVDLWRVESVSCVEVCRDGYGQTVRRSAGRAARCDADGFCGGLAGGALECGE